MEESYLTEFNIHHDLKQQQKNPKNSQQSV